jgi:hypothetical protein
MPMKKTRSTRRTMLKNGAGIFGVGVLSGNVSASATDDGSDSNNEEDTDVQPELITNTSTRWSPQSIDFGERSTCQCEWEIIVPTGVTDHQLDILIQLEDVHRPVITATNFQPDDTPEFVYRSDTPLGPAWHFRTSILAIAPTHDVHLNARVRSRGTGRVQARVGTWPASGFWDGMWSVGYLDIE